MGKLGGERRLAQPFQNGGDGVRIARVAPGQPGRKPRPSARACPPAGGPLRRQQFLHLRHDDFGEQIIAEKGQVNVLVKQVVAGNAFGAFFFKYTVGIGQRHAGVAPGRNRLTDQVIEPGITAEPKGIKVPRGDELRLRIGGIGQRAGK